MNYITHNTQPISIDGTHGVGQIQCDYQKLVAAFGLPMKEGFDDYKCDAEWHVSFDDGTVASIYNWKNGYNYLGTSGKPTTEIKIWNIGGRDKHAVDRVVSAIRN